MLCSGSQVRDAVGQAQLALASPPRASSGQVGDALGLLRDAARHATGISADARDVQPLLALAVVLIDLRQLEEAGSILHAVGQSALTGTFSSFCANPC